MRLFLGITFQEEILQEVGQTIHRLKKNSIKGNFTRKKNLHLTLAFLGEIDERQIIKIEEIMNSIDMNPFVIELDILGKFRSRGGDIYWIGFKESAQLQRLYEELSRKLRKNGFLLEDRPYTPHLTLGRKVILDEKIDIETLSKEIPNLQIEVSEIHLIQSHRVDEVLTYTPIRTKLMQN
jgi:2'-5' RNA ligase